RGGGSRTCAPTSPTTAASTPSSSAPHRAPPTSPPCASPPTASPTHPRAPSDGPTPPTRDRRPRRCRAPRPRLEAHWGRTARARRAIGRSTPYRSHEEQRSEVTDVSTRSPRLEESYRQYAGEMMMYATFLVGPAQAKRVFEDAWCRLRALG